MNSRPSLGPPPTYRPLTVGHGMRGVAAHSPAKIALREGGRSLTYARFSERSERVTGFLAGSGLLPGQRVAILAPNCLEYMEIVVGASSAGLAIATLNPRLVPREIGAICDDCDARVLFVHPSLEALARATTYAGAPRIVVIGDEYEGVLSTSNRLPPRPDIQEWDAFSIPYTSGTTGKPKGVLLPHRSRVLTFMAMGVEYACYTPADDYLAIAPLYHGAGLAFAMASIYFGGSCEILPSFNAEQVIEKLSAGATGTFMVPTHFHALFALGAARLDRARRHRLKAIVSNAAPLPQATKERIVDLWGDGVLHETYGSTEAAIVTNLRPEYQLAKLKCVGKPFACTQVRLLGEDGRDVAPGEVGELFSTSPYLFNGYHGKPAETEAAFRDGWFSAGDMAQRDEEGFLYLVDRKTDMILSGGVNIYPREIEEILFRHPAIAEAAVIGAPDEHWGESVVAFVVSRAGAEASADEVVAYCREHLAPYKVPKQVISTPSLPRNAAGKVLKTELRALARAPTGARPS